MRSLGNSNSEGLKEGLGSFLFDFSFTRNSNYMSPIENYQVKELKYRAQCKVNYLSKYGDKRKDKIGRGRVGKVKSFLV